MNESQQTKIKKSFGTRVRAIRNSAAISQEALALKCGLDRTYIGGVERGERNISLVNMHKMAKALEVSLREFFE